MAGSSTQYAQCLHQSPLHHHKQHAGNVSFEKSDQVEIQTWSKRVDPAGGQIPTLKRLCPGSTFSLPEVGAGDWYVRDQLLDPLLDGLLRCQKRPQLAGGEREPSKGQSIVFVLTHTVPKC